MEFGADVKPSNEGQLARLATYGMWHSSRVGSQQSGSVSLATLFGVVRSSIRDGRRVRNASDDLNLVGLSAARQKLSSASRRNRGNEKRRRACRGVCQNRHGQPGAVVKDSGDVLLCR